MNKPIFLLLTVLLSSAIAGATSGEHSAGVPTVVFWQFINLVILFSGLIYILKDKVKKSFLEKRENYLLESAKSQKAEKEAERQYQDLKHRLEKLQEGAAESKARAEVEAAELKAKVIADAQSQAQKIKEEAQDFARIETSKAYRALKQATVQEAFRLARQVLSKDIGSQDHSKLQSQFAENLNGVNP